MRHSTLIFVAAAFALLTFSRLALAAWQWQRVRNAGGLLPLMLGGLRIDAHQIAVMAALPAVLSPWFGHFRSPPTRRPWYLASFILLAFLEIASPAFILEYDSRPNRLFVEYLKHPREVSGMLWRGYKAALVGGLVLVALIGWGALRLFWPAAPDAPLSWWQMPLTSLAILAVVILSIRGTLGHRPMNPSSVAYSSDGMLNTLALNSLYNVFYAVYSMKNEKSASAVYGNMDEAEMHERVLRQAGLPVPPANADYPSLHAQPATRKTKRPLNVVIILEESLGAQYSAALGGANLTPELDALARESWAFTRAYATGTRSVRGLEAVVTGFLPTPAQAVLKLPRSQRGFFSLADLLGRHGYHSRFIYGGESHFDNMKGFSWAMVSSRSWTARTSWIRPSSAPGAHRTKTCSTSWTGCCAQTATSPLSRWPSASPTIRPGSTRPAASRSTAIPPPWRTPCAMPTGRWGASSSAPRPRRIGKTRCSWSRRTMTRACSAPAWCRCGTSISPP